MIWLILFVVASQIADAYTTHRLLERGGVERNPFMAPLVERLGVLPLAVIKCFIGVALVYYSWPLLWPGIAAGVLFFGVALNNARLMR